MATEQPIGAKNAEDAEHDATHRQVVAFRLGSENFGVDIGVVREIIRRQSVTQLPAAPESVEGVIDLRGAVIPVVDLCTRLDIGIAEESDESRIIVLEVSGATIGVFVDEVTEVLRVPTSAIDPLSVLGSRAGSTFIDGIAKVEGGLLSLLQLDDALSADGLRAFKAEHHGSSATDETSAPPLELPLPIEGVEAPEPAEAEEPAEPIDEAIDDRGHTAVA